MTEKGWLFLYGFMIGIIITCVVGFYLIQPIFPPPNHKDIVNCNDYYKITDKYRIVDEGNYIVARGNTYQILDFQYNKVIIGQYVKISEEVNWLAGVPPFYIVELRNITPLNESETDFRGACRVMV